MLYRFMDTNLEEIWKITLAQIEVKLDSPAHFKTWFKDTSLLDLKGNQAIIGVKNSYSTDWLKKRHNHLICETLSYVYGQKVSAKYQIDGNLANLPTPKVTANELIKEAPIFGIPDQQNVLSKKLQESGLNPKYSFESYIVGPSNKLAHAAAIGVAKNPGEAYNPLFIYGKTGLGKTHLAQAVGRYVLEQDLDKKIYYASSEGFLNDMVKSIRQGKNMEFRQKYRTLDLLIIDDIQFLSKWQETQNEFFNTFNVLYNDHKQIILISDRPPEMIEKIEDRLRSRFQGGMIADVSRPNFETRLAIIQIKAKELAIDLPSRIIELIAKLVTDNIRELEGALQKIALYSSMKDTPLSDEEISRILGRDKKSRQEKIKPVQVIKKIAKEFNLSVKEIKGPRRTADLAFARQVCMYILREEFGYKLEDIAEMLERKDHTTVIHALDKIKSKMLLDEGFRLQLDLIKQELNV